MQQEVGVGGPGAAGMQAHGRCTWKKTLEGKMKRKSSEKKKKNNKDLRGGKKEVKEDMSGGKRTGNQLKEKLKARGRK